MFDPAEEYNVEKNLQKILRARGVPYGFVDSKLCRDFSLEILQQINSAKGYFICGPCGVGKTHLAVAIMAQQIMAFSKKTYQIGDCVHGVYGAWFYPVTSLLNRIKASFAKDAAEIENDIIEEVASFELIVLDDIGTEKVSDWSLQTLYTIIDICSREEKPIIVTSNFPLDRIASSLSDRIASRISGLCKVIEMSGDDRRIAKP